MSHWADDMDKAGIGDTVDADLKPLKPRYTIGQRVIVRTATFGERVATIRTFRFGEDGENLVVVDLDPPAGRSPTGASMGWVFDERQIIGPAGTPGPGSETS